MNEVLPSQALQAIEQMFGTNRSELGPGVRHFQMAEVITLLKLLECVPQRLLTLPFHDYLEYNKCRAILQSALPGWQLGGLLPARDTVGRDPVELLRRLLKRCPDATPDPASDLAFIEDVDARTFLEERMRAAWMDFKSGEWLGATVFAAAVLEGVLMWFIKERCDGNGPKRLEDLHLLELIKTAEKRGLLSQECLAQARLAKDARNLVHPGVAAHQGTQCTQSSALTALAGMHRVIEELKLALTGNDGPKQE